MKKGTKRDPPRTRGADQSPEPERVNGRAGLRRLEETMRRLLRMPKSVIEDPAKDH